jgi:hypothetical protein
MKVGRKLILSLLPHRQRGYRQSPLLQSEEIASIIGIEAAYVDVAQVEGGDLPAKF